MGLHLRLMAAFLAFDCMLLSNSVVSFTTGRPPSKATRTKNVRPGVGQNPESPGALRAYDSSGETGATPSGGPWKLPNDFNAFLNQCSIQSFIFLVNSFRDRHTALWLEDFTQPVIHQRTINKERNDDKTLSSMAKALQDNMPEEIEQEIKLLTYHGLGAINTTLFPTWDSYFEKLLNQPGVTYLIESDRPHVPSYELEINPISLCTRIISVREQIAREFAKDLDVVAEMSETMIDTHFERMKGDKDPEKLDVEQVNFLFLQLGVGPDLQSTTEYKPSPLRSGNFDLLMLMTTQESIHRVLNNALETAATIDQSSIQFLRNFYSQRLGTHFTGSNWYGRADDFLEELLATPPSVVQLQDEKCGLIDPVGIARAILHEREQVAVEWLDIALDAPLSHSSIKRQQLNRQMGVDTSPTNENSFQ